MSTRHLYGQRRYDRASSRSGLGGPDVACRQLTWLDIQPVLLRSAALVGIGAAIAAAVANNAFLVGPEPRPALEAAVLIVQDEHDNSAATADGLSERAETIAAAAPSPAESSGASGAPTGAPLTEVGSGAAVARAPVALRQAAAAPPPPSPSDTANERAEEPATVGSLPPTDCPRDWIGNEGAAGDGASCPQSAALMPEPDDTAAQRLLEDAASERATEIAALQFVPRIPKARPEPPAQPRKTGRKASWPADDPPNCGKKRARWRYVNDVPTWYCR